MTSLEGVWNTGVRSAELETLMLLGSRGCPLLTVANGPLMARRSLRPELGRPADVDDGQPGTQAYGQLLFSSSDSSASAARTSSTRAVMRLLAC